MERSQRLANVSVIIIGMIGVFTVLRIGEGIFAPLALAFVIGVVLSPLSDFWESRGLPPVVGALSGLLATLVILGTLVLVFQPIVLRVVEQAPKVWADMQQTIRVMQGLLQSLTDMADDVSDAIAPGAAAAPESDQGREASVEFPTVTDALLLAPAILGQIAVFGGSLFFFILTRAEIYDWIAKHLSESGERQNTARKLRAAERSVSRYFLTITMVNAGLGAATAVVLQLIGLPDAIFWGLAACLVNFIVYLGPAVYLVSLLFAGIAAFDGFWSVLPAASFVVLNFLEGQFVTPAFIGRNLEMNPLLVFVALVAGIWLWGPIGGFVAIPLLLWVLVLNDQLRANPADEQAAAVAETAAPRS